MKKGFTLIELLAVFVILAIIATITIPIVQNLTSNSKKEGALRSAELYINAVDQALIDKNLSDGLYAVKDGNICLDETCTQVIEIDLKNNKPESGYINIRYLAVSYVSDLKFNKYYISTLNISSITDNSLIATLSPSGKAKLYKSGDVVYFDVVNGTSCTNYTSDNSLSGYNGLSTTKTKSSQNSCLKFYAFLDDGGDKINLLLDHNTTHMASIGSGTLDLSGLYNDTKEWKGTITPQNYEYTDKELFKNSECEDCLGNLSVNYTIDYQGYKARLLTAEEVFKITGFSLEKVTGISNTYYYFQSNSTDSTKTNECAQNGSCEYAWLYDRTSIDCTTSGCSNNSITDFSCSSKEESSDSIASIDSSGSSNTSIDSKISKGSLEYIGCGADGFWTSTYQGIGTIGNSYYYVSKNGKLSSAEINTLNIAGIRPVIEVSKSKLG